MATNEMATDAADDKTTNKWLRTLIRKEDAADNCIEVWYSR